MLVLEMGGHAMVPSLPENLSSWIQFSLADTGGAVGRPGHFSSRGWQSLVQRSLNMFTLIALGIGAAWTYSVVAILAPEVFPPAFRMDGTVAVYFEAASVITVLVLLGQVLELRAREHTSSAIRALLNLAPRTARRLKADGSEDDAPIDAIVVGESVAGAAGRDSAGGRHPDRGPLFGG